MMSIIKFPRNHNSKAPQKIMICREFPGPINRRWKEKGANILRTNLVPRVLSYPPLRSKRENLGTRLTANVVGREGLATEGEGRQTPRPSFFAKRKLRSQLRRIFAELLGSYQCGFCKQEEVMSITCFILCRPLYITGKSVSIKTSGQKERHRN